MKNIIKKWWFWVSVALIILTICILLFTNKKTKFEITDFSISKDTTEYTYSDNYVTYEGKGIVTTKDKKGVYIVVLEEKLVAGGNEEAEGEEENTNLVLVTNGKGEFGTYDYGNEGEIKKPTYKFEILGYVKVN